MPARKKAAPVKPEGFDDVYIVVESTQRIYYFNGPTFYEYINQSRKAIGERRDIVFMTEFPLPRTGRYNSDYNDSREEKDNWGENGKAQYFGRYCPFQAGHWPHNGVLVLKNGAIFVPVVQEVTRVVREYCDAIIAATDATPGVTEAPTITPSKKAPVRRSRR